MRNKAKVIGGGAAAIFMAGFLALSTKWEGLSLSPYEDPLVPGLMTVCYGETNVEMRRYTKEECTELLKKRGEEYDEVMRRRLTPRAYANLNPYQRAAIASWIHNFGETQFRRSTLLKKLNEGDIFNACFELMRWRKVGSKTVDGLVNRRVDEMKYCLKEDL